MLSVRYKCPNCGHVFKKLGLFAESDSTAKCPNCGQARVPLLEEDRKALEVREKDRCSSYG